MLYLAFAQYSKPFRADCKTVMVKWMHEYANSGTDPFAGDAFGGQLRRPQNPFDKPCFAIHCVSHFQSSSGVQLAGFLSSIRRAMSVRQSGSCCNRKCRRKAANSFCCAAGRLAIARINSAMLVALIAKPGQARQQGSLAVFWRFGLPPVTWACGMSRTAIKWSAYEIVSASCTASPK